MKIEAHILKYGAELDWMRECVPTIEAWTARHGFPITVWDDRVAAEKGYPKAKFAEREMLEAFLSGDSDFMIYMDIDVRVHPETPLPPLQSGLSMATDCLHAEHQKHWTEWCKEYKGFTPDDSVPYSNAGVWICDRGAAKSLLKYFKPPFVEFFMDQHEFMAAAYLAAKDGMTFNRLPSEWNRYGRDFEPSWFFHLWGDTKMRDLEDLRYSGILDLKPNGLRYSFHPGHTPYQDKMVVLQFVRNCGLGNMLFEMAAGLGIARQLGLPLRWNWNPESKRSFDLGHFGLGVPPFRQYPVVSARLGQGNAEIVDHCLHAITDTEHRFPAVSHPYQAEECFANVADEVRELFKLDPLPLDVPEGRTPVAVQVRRGDYVNHPRLDVVTEAYFLNAMDFIRRRIKHPTFFFVSDDPVWCRQRFARLPDTVIMPPQSAIDGLRTMAACSSHIISNSTFGWWGAWLAEDGPVVVPEIWHHKPGSYGKWQPAPDRWHRVPIKRPLPARVVVSPPVPPAMFTEHPMEHERAVVVPWHADQDKWQSLRYCLRSVHANLTDRNCPIVVLGTRRPTWLLHGNQRVRFIEAWSYQDALMRGVQIAGETLWMNDDIVLLKPSGWEDFRRPLHFGPVTPEFLADFEERPNPWRDGFRQMVDRVRESGVKEVLNYSTHVPYLFERDKAIATIQRFGVHHKAPFEGYYFNAHAGAAAKPMNGERASELPLGEARFLNHTDARLSGELKEAVKTMFPDFAPWELRARFDA